MKPVSLGKSGRLKVSPIKEVATKVNKRMFSEGKTTQTVVVASSCLNRTPARAWTHFVSLFGALGRMEGTHAFAV